MPSNGRYIVAGAALGACLGALAGWRLTRRAALLQESSTALQEIDRSRALRVLWAVVGVVRLILEMDPAQS